MLFKTIKKIKVNAGKLKKLAQKGIIVMQNKDALVILEVLESFRM
jgi:hypothetical protein